MENSITFTTNLKDMEEMGHNLEQIIDFTSKILYTSVAIEGVGVVTDGILYKLEDMH